MAILNSLDYRVWVTYSHPKSVVKTHKPENLASKGFCGIKVL
jgi:hypothetical protein